VTTAELLPFLAASAPDFDPRPEASYDAERDAEWLSGLRAGHLSAFDNNYLGVVPALLQFARRFVAADVAEDVVQDVLVDLWERRDRVVVRGTLRGYLFGATRRRIADLRRREGVAERHAAVVRADEVAAHDGESVIDVHELDCAVHDALATLSDRARLILMMRWGDGLSYPEIAEALEISVESAKKQGHRTELMVRALLARFAP
jgi:RNA polymerase sigma-70 factor (ECF subfamily)